MHTVGRALRLFLSANLEDHASFSTTPHRTESARSIASVKFVSSICSILSLLLDYDHKYKEKILLRYSSLVDAEEEGKINQGRS